MGVGATLTTDPDASHARSPEGHGRFIDIGRLSPLVAYHLR
jgi:hypothetical protein